ncbi:SDR family NAD(P)-dependent oxidoreductase [Nocardia sp. NPDC002869]|uniref:SDR family NAD(P)-dependent oxidoreductase n=1 Tax=Nocardia sp. NPDC002869 TaxID=3161032 RepID=UPI00398D385F
MGAPAPDGKVAVVAGGATGLGAATAVRLGAQGWRVVVGDLRKTDAAGTSEKIAAAGGVALAVAFDLADPVSVAGLFEQATRRFGGVDALFDAGADMRTLRQFGGPPGATVPAVRGEHHRDAEEPVPVGAAPLRTGPVSESIRR